MSAPFDGVRRAAGDVLTTLADLGHTRLQLAAVELEEERLRLVRLALLAAIAFFLLGLGLVVAAVFAVLLVDPPYRVPLLGAIAAASLVGAAIAWRQWRIATCTDCKFSWGPCPRSLPDKRWIFRSS